jgi:hypothetical protein
MKLLVPILYSVRGDLSQGTSPRKLDPGIWILSQQVQADYSRLLKLLHSIYRKINVPDKPSDYRGVSRLLSGHSVVDNLHCRVCASARTLAWRGRDAEGGGAIIAMMIYSSVKLYLSFANCIVWFVVACSRKYCREVCRVYSVDRIRKLENGPDSKRLDQLTILLFSIHRNSLIMMCN